MVWNNNFAIPFYDVSIDIEAIHDQVLQFIINISPSYLLMIIFMAVIGFIVYMIWYLREAVQDMTTEKQ